MVAPGKERASGETGATEEAVAASAEIDTLIDVPEPEAETMRTPRFHRMRFNLDPRTRAVYTQAHTYVDREINQRFADLLFIVRQIYDIVRVAQTDEEGNVVTDAYGNPVWVTLPNGNFDEDFLRLTRGQKEHLMFLITTRMFTWEQRAAELYADALFAKGNFEERFAIAYDAPRVGTVDDRKQRGTMDAAEERYYAIFATALSRRADAMVRSMDRLAMRLRDSLG